MVFYVVDLVYRSGCSVRSIFLFSHFSAKSSQSCQDKQAKDQMTKQKKLTEQSNHCGTLRVFYLQVAKHVAKKLNFENWKAFSGHSFRRSACQQMANEDATAAQMMNKFGWNSANQTSKLI